MIDLKIKAIRQLGYTGGLSKKNDVVTFQSNENVPSESAIQVKITELQAEYEANQYQRDRAEQYPSIQDVVVALAEKEEGNDAMWQEITAQRAKVKSDNPKPE